MLLFARRFETSGGSCEQAARRIDSRRDFSFIGQTQLVFASEYLVREVAQSIMGDSRVSFRAQLRLAI